jgi:hypothetical protein
MLNVSKFRMPLVEANLLSDAGNTLLDLRQGDAINVNVTNTTINTSNGGSLMNQDRLAALKSLRDKGYLVFNPLPQLRFDLRDPQKLGASTAAEILDARSAGSEGLFLIRALHQAAQAAGNKSVTVNPAFLSQWKLSENEFLDAVVKIDHQMTYFSDVIFPAIAIEFTPKGQGFNTNALTDAQIRQLFSDRLISQTIYSLMAMQLDGVSTAISSGFYTKWALTPSDVLTAILALTQHKFLQTFDTGTVNLTYPAAVTIPVAVNPLLNPAGMIYQQLKQVASIQAGQFAAIAGVDLTTLFRSLNQLQTAGLIAYQAGAMRVTWAANYIPVNAPANPNPPATPSVGPFVQPNRADAGEFGSFAPNYEPIFMIDGSGLSVRNETGLYDGAGSVWASSGGGTSGSLMFEFDTNQMLSKFYLWPRSGADINQTPKTFRLRLLDAANNQLLLTPEFTVTQPTANPSQPAQTFSFGQTPGVRKVEMQISSNYGSTYVAIAEVGFA